MKSITIELDESTYNRYEYLATSLNKTVDAYAKKQIENITDTFYERVRKMNGD